jgi:hypothetical protein
MKSVPAGVIGAVLLATSHAFRDTRYRWRDAAI